MAIIIAEFCQNHKGDRRLLREMVWAAAEAGADYAKVQSIRADELTFRPQFEEGVVADGVTRTIKRPYQPEYDRLKPLDLDEEAYLEFIEECARAGIKPLTTIFTRAAIALAASLPWKEVKVASYDCASYPLLRELRKRFDHLYISTGSMYDHEIEEAARVLSGHSFTFLHCVTIYPTPLEEAHLARMDYLRRLAPSVGFSDHSLVARDGNKAALAAISLGAEVVERHFTILPPDQTRDGPVSVDPVLLRQLTSIAHSPIEKAQAYVKAEIPELDRMIGRERRELSHTEVLNRDYYRGRFASKIDGRVIHNWENSPIE